jgi:hypothetical protein
LFTKTDFWIGLAVGLVAGVFGYRAYNENRDKIHHMLPTPQEEPGDLRLEELMKQKERLEDLIAEKQAAAAS